MGEPFLVDPEELGIRISEVIQGLGVETSALQCSIRSREKPLDAAERVQQADQFSAAQTWGAYSY